MHSVPDCQGQLAEQICADTGTKTKQQLEEKFGLTRLIGIYQSTSNAIHTTFFFLKEHAHIQDTGRRKSYQLRFISIPSLICVSKL